MQIHTHTHTHTHTHPTHTHLCIYEVSFFRDVTSILKKELNYLRKENWWKKGERDNLVLSERSDSRFGDNMDHLEHVFEFSLIHSPALVQLLSRVQLSATPWTAAHQASLSITYSKSLSKLMSIESVMPSNHLILCRPALNLPQHQGLFKWVSSSHQVAKVLEFQLQHQSFQWTPRTDLL